MQIDKNVVVALHYKVATAEGELVDQSSHDEPLNYLHGSGQIIPGLEEALIGKGAGEKVEATVSPDKAYGNHDPALDMVVPVDAFPKDARNQLKPGFRFRAEHPERDQEEIFFTVHGIKDGQVQVSGNHPLAGQTLIFQVEIVSVRAATSDELAHGHAHGPGGHHH